MRARRCGHLGALVTASLVVVVSACTSGQNGLVVRTPPTSRPKAVAPTTVASTSRVPAAPTQQLTVTPSTGLTSGQSVLVHGSGFAGGESLIVLECAAMGGATTQADCNIDGIQSVTSNPDGTLTTNFTVVRGPFGSARITCSATQPCLLSVTQPVPSPTQEADQHISFR